MQGPDSVMPVATWRRKCAERRQRKKNLKKVVDENDGYDAMLLTMQADVSTGIK